MISCLGKIFSNIAKRWLPDAFLFAIILVLLVFILGMAVEGTGFLAMTGYFGSGVWSFLTFSMQMALIIVTGSALANSKPIHAALKTMAKSVKTATQAIIMVSFVMALCSWLNWGFGLIVGALLAKELARNVKGIHYPLLVASAYSGFLIWHAGLSASIPLKLTGSDPIMEKFADGFVIPVSQTIFTWQNLLLVAILLLFLPILNSLMQPKRKEEILEIDPSVFGDEEVLVKRSKNKEEMTPAEKMENSLLLSALIAGIGMIYIINYFLFTNGSINLNIVNFCFLTFGIILHKTPINYVKAVNQAVKSCGGVILQFPFYAGIMGMMINSGLAQTFSQGFVNIANQTTFPFFSFLSAGLVNFFVPSGGGQWGVQGPVLIPAAGQLNVSYATTAMAIAWGDAWTNMIQPFWALPLLGVAKLNIRDIMGYTTVILLFSGVIISAFMLFVF